MKDLRVNGKIICLSTALTGAVRGKKGVHIGKKAISIECEISPDGGEATANALLGIDAKIHFGFDVLASGVSISPNEKRAMIICDLDGYEVRGTGYNTDDGFRFNHLGSVTRVVAEYCVRDHQYITQWHVSQAQFNGRNRHSIRIAEDSFILEMPEQLAKRYLMRYSEEPFLPREQMVCLIKAYIDGTDKVSIPWKVRLKRIVEALAVTYARTFGLDAALPQREEPAKVQPAAAAPLQPAIELSVVEPAAKTESAEEPEPEDEANFVTLVAVGGGEPAMMDGPIVDPQKIAGMEAEAMNPGGREGRNRRRPPAPKSHVKGSRGGRKGGTKEE